MNPSINILIAHYRSDIVSGAERSIADLVAQLDLRFRVTMLVPAEGKLADFYREIGYDVWVQQVETPRRLYPGLHQLQSWLFARKLRERGFDVVLANTFSAAGRVRTACRLAKVPLGVYVREIISDRPANREILAAADQVMVISKDLKEHVSKLTDPNKVVLTYNYIDPEPILEQVRLHARSGRRNLPFERGTPVVGLIGRITPWKQQDLFVRAAQLILVEEPDTRFVIVGDAAPRDQAYYAQVRELVNRLGLKDKVIFMGQRSDAIAITSELTVATLTSTREPLGRVILEAQLLGVPLVTPDNAGPAEIVVPEETGLMFNSTGPDATERFAHQVLRLLKSPALRLRLAEQAREAVNNSFASHKHVRIQEETIEALSRKHRPESIPA